MARRLRVEYAGAIYHVMNRGDRGELIFLDERDRMRFVETLAEVCLKTDWQVHAYVLMSNHFHLVVETPEPNLVAGMKWFLGTYTGRFNRRHQLFGHLFAGRYKSLIVDGSGNGYLKTVCDYVHLNPARAKLLPTTDPLKSYHWSSWPMYLRAPTRRPTWLRVDRLLRAHGIPKDSLAGRRFLERSLEGRRAIEAEDFRSVRSGWCLGDETFRAELLAQMGDQMGPEHYGAERSESAEAKAEHIIKEAMAYMQWDQHDLISRSKGDVEKVKLAVRLRAETTMTVAWIAKRLEMGSRNYVNHLLHSRKSKDK